MLDQMLELFGIQPDYDLDVMRPARSLTDLTVAVLARLDPYRTADGFEPYGKVSDADRAKLKTSMAELSELLSQVSGSLGLQVNG